MSGIIDIMVSYNRLRHYLNKELWEVRSFFQESFQYESRLDENIEWIYQPRLSNLSQTKLGESFLESSRVLRILYVAMRYDYGQLRRGLSYEENNFFHSLLNMGHQIIRFDFKALEKKFGRSRMNRMLLETVYRYDPDLMFVVLFRNELDNEVVKEISTRTRTITINWFCDDHWRFDNYSRYWAPVFNWVVTTAKSVLPKYKEIGYENVIHAQWACNHFLYRKLDLPYLYDVTFVGQPHGNRRQVISRLKKAGIDVKVWGYGWAVGRVSQSEMIKIFNQSKINLNLSNASRPGVEQIKGRDFEVPGCGGFLITGYAENIEEYFDVGKEIVCYRDVDDLVNKIRHYLKYDDEREAIAKAGYARVLREHTYERRFRNIFRTIGVSQT